MQLGILENQLGVLANHLGILEMQLGVLEIQLGLLEMQLGLLENHLGILAKILALVLKFLTAGEARGSERDSSGTTVATKCERSEAQGAKVMERIARREERSDEAARPISN